MTEKIDLFKELIPLIDKGDIDLIKELEDEFIKYNNISPFIVMKVMSAVFGNNQEYAIMAINEVVNKGFWQLSDHPKLQLMLITLCSIQKLNNTKQIRHYFPGKRKNDAIFNQIRKWYPTWKDDEVDMLLNLYSKEDLIQLAQDFGMQEKELKEWKKILS